MKNWEVWTTRNTCYYTGDEPLFLRRFKDKGEARRWVTRLVSVGEWRSPLDYELRRR